MRKFSAEKDARVMKKIREYQAMYPSHSDGTDGSAEKVVRDKRRYPVHSDGLTEEQKKRRYPVHSDGLTEEQW